MNEATARIKINKLLERAGWRFFPEGEKPANIRLEQSVQVKQVVLDSLGDDFEKTKNGVMDFLLLDERGFPFIVLEAKSEEQQPLTGKEQARMDRTTTRQLITVLSAWTPQEVLSINARKNPVLHPCLILSPLSDAVFLGTEPVVITLTEGEQRDDEGKIGPSPGISEVAEYQGD